MKIITRWDESMLLKEAHNDISGSVAHAHVSLTIYAHCGAFVYPAENWNDYGAVMLGLWLGEMAGILTGATETAIFAFLDGPQPLSARVVSSGMLLVTSTEGPRFECTTPARELGMEILLHSQQVAGALRSLNICQRDVRTLESGLDGLRRLDLQG